MKKLISIIIPTKNEQDNISNLLNSLCHQIDDRFEIILADANSTDNTIQEAKNIYNNIIIVEGGLPAVGRNNGAKFAINSEYLLFIDADIILSYDIIYDLLKKISYYNVDLLTANFAVKDNLISNFIYKLSNLTMHLSKFDKPFAVGGFILIKNNIFKMLGGFDEKAMHCEDYLLSKQINPNNFYILNNTVYTTDRRLKKMGYIGMIKYFIKNIINRNNINYFRKDVGYWK